MGRKSEYLKTIGKTKNLKSVGKIAKGLIPYVGEWDFSESMGKYRVPFTIISGTTRWTGLLLGLIKNPIFYHGYSVPTIGVEYAIARDEIFKK